MDGLLPFSVIFILFPGLYLVFSAWGWGVAWVNISLATLVIMTFMGPAINLRRLKRILIAANTTETGKTPSSSLVEMVKDRTLWNSVMIMTILGVAILFLMTVKLAMVGSLIVLGIAIILGFITANMVLKGAPSLNHSSVSNNESSKL